MNLDHSFLEIVKGDFAALWSCKQHNGTLEISTPFLYPTSSLARVFITQREDRFVVTENGDIAEVLSELFPNEDFTIRLRELAAHYEIKLGSHEGVDVFFKDCTDPKLITSLVFDMADFSTKAAGVLTARQIP